MVIQMNCKLRKVVVTNCRDSLVQVLDSVVVGSRAIDIVGCTGLTLMLDELDVRAITIIDSTGVTLRIGNTMSVIDNVRTTWIRSAGAIERTVVPAGTDPNQTVVIPTDTLARFPVDGSERSVVAWLRSLDDLHVEAAVAPRDRADVERELREYAESTAASDAVPENEWARLYAAEVAEYREPASELAQHVRVVAALLRDARSPVVYTGAGISTSAQLPDYRGPQGVWTHLSLGVQQRRGVELDQALPTYAHYALAELLRRGLIRFITSTNLDGLHRRSGVRAHEIAELHGNCYREVCANCEREYLRAFNTLYTRDDRWTHRTGRVCDGCGGALKDTIVHFTENVPAREWDPAVEKAYAADMSLVLGTSMCVQPAASLPDKCLAHGGKLVIVNLQPTPYDSLASVRVYAETDDFMRLLMEELGIPEFDRSYDHVAVLTEHERGIARRRLTQRVAGYIGGFLGVVALVAVWWPRATQAP